jgi:hypothetical protein
MTKLLWDQVGQRLYETGVDRGVLYIRDENGDYSEGHAWNGLTTVTESPSGAESNKQYADNIVYLNLVSAEEFGATIEAFMYPEAFAECNGEASFGGVAIGQQSRKTFGFAYRTRVGNDVDGSDHGYKLHLVYGCLAAPSEKAYATMNESPEAMTMSWEVSTTPVDVGTFEGREIKPTASLTVDSTKEDAANMQALEDILYGTAGADARLPLPAEVLSLFNDVLVEAETAAPTYNAATDEVTVPSTPGVVYEVDGETVTGTFVITEDTVVTARPAEGYTFTDTSDTDWTINYS